MADDHQMFREALRNLLAAEPDLAVIADAGDGRTAVRLAEEMSPDVVVMDVTMPDLNGIDATRKLLAASQRTRVLGLSMHSDLEFVTEMLAAGASGYLLKDGPFDELLSAIRAAARGEVYLSPRVAGVIMAGALSAAGAAPHPQRGVLTPREREILQMVAEGKSSKQIALELGLSAKTVDTHRRQVMEKLQLYSVAELTHYAIRQGMTVLH